MAAGQRSTQAEEGFMDIRLSLVDHGQLAESMQPGDGALRNPAEAL